MGKVMQEGSDGITSKPNDLALIFTLSHNVSVGQSSGPPRLGAELPAGLLDHNLGLGDDAATDWRVREGWEAAGGLPDGPLETLFPVVTQLPWSEVGAEEGA